MTRNAHRRAVLIVDDSLTVRMDLCDAFESAGVATLSCPTLAEARELLAREAIGLVILDVMLPDGDGTSLLRELRQRPRTEHMPVLMLSAEAEVKDRIRGLEVGADEYVGKPYDTGYVVARTLQLMRVTETQPPPADAKTVLLIDDSLTFREVLRDALEAHGYRVICAAEGEEGLRIAADRRPDALVVDGFLPGVDGATVIRRVRLDAALRHTPCLLLTASDAHDAELRALEAGADAFVRKDEDVEIVLARLSVALRGTTSPLAGLGGSAASLLGPKKVLAVDDDPAYLSLVAMALRAEGYDVVSARSGPDALQMLAVQTVDCILLDLQMPGMSGQETCGLIKAAPFSRDIPVIFLSGGEDHRAMIDALANGADDFIGKSVDLEVLKARVRAQLRRKQLELETRQAREALLHRELEAAEARAARELAETRAVLVEELERKNRELEAFGYSVSHDLRAPLRAIDGFSQALLEEYGSALDAAGIDYLRRVRASAQRMRELIDDLLSLSRVGRAELVRERVDLSELAHQVLSDLREREPERALEVEIATGLAASGDKRLLKIVFENLLGNAWKFTTKTPAARLEIGASLEGDAPSFYVRDNGAGFDMRFADKLFRPFQRLHQPTDFVGTGIGLATVQRIVERHGGKIWAEGEPGHGARFSFTLPPKRNVPFA